MNRSETLKARIRSGKPVFGTFVKNNCPNLVEMLGWAGFDFAILDCEHSSYSYGELENMIRACQLAGLASIPRIACPEPWQVHHGLESGATGVQIPSIRSVENAAECAQEAVFFPGGTRSPNPALRAGQYGCWTGEKSYLETKKESSLCVVQVESMAMAAAVEELCRIPQIDVLFVGPGDLSMSMGKPGKLNDPEVAAVIEDVMRRGLAGGKAMGMLCGNADAVKKYVDLGCTYLAYASDSGMIANAFRQVSRDVFAPYR